MLCVPVESFYADYITYSNYQVMYNYLKDSFENGYILSADTASYSWSYYNYCGIPNRHAFSILAVFELSWY